MKKKIANRPDWFRILEKRYAQTFLEEERFTGYVSLLTLKKVKEPLYVNYNGKDVCIVNDGYLWLMHFPTSGNYAVTTTIDNKGNIVQWYIDIIRSTGLTEAGIPYIEDLYLDIVYLPDGNMYVLDHDELEDAYANEVITETEYFTAKETVAQLTQLIADQQHYIITETPRHLELLMNL